MSSRQTKAGSPDQPAPQRERVPLEKRREQAIDAALIEFGKSGFAGTSTSTIAKRASIHQPYIYAMFENKLELFVACNRELNDRLLTSFRDSRDPEDPPSEQLRTISVSYRELLENEPWARCHFQFLASAGDPALRQTVSEGFDRLFADVEDLTCASESQVAALFAASIMASAMDAMGKLPDMVDQLPLPGDGLREPSV